MEKDDNELIKEYINGNESAFQALVARHTKAIYSFVFRLCGKQEASEDIVQETFLKAWKNIKKYDQTKNFRVWIFTIARNTTYDYMRKKKSMVFSELDNDENDTTFEENIADTMPLADSVFEEKENAEIFGQSIKSLPKKYREIVALRHETGMTFEEISLLTKEPMNTVKSRYRRAIIKLREYLTLHQNNDPYRKNIV